MSCVAWRYASHKRAAYWCMDACIVWPFRWPLTRSHCIESVWQCNESLRTSSTVAADSFLPGGTSSGETHRLHDKIVLTWVGVQEHDLSDTFWAPMGFFVPLYCPLLNAIDVFSWHVGVVTNFAISRINNVLPYFQWVVHVLWVGQIQPNHW